MLSSNSKTWGRFFEDWVAILWYFIGPITTLHCWITAREYRDRLGNQVLPMIDIISKQWCSFPRWQWHLSHSWNCSQPETLWILRQYIFLHSWSWIQILLLPCKKKKKHMHMCMHARTHAHTHSNCKCVNQSPEKGVEMTYETLCILNTRQQTLSYINFYNESTTFIL
jgi:hypothetical protein